MKRSTSVQNDYAFASIGEVGELIRTGGLSPVALAEYSLERIEALNPELNAFITVTVELARQQAIRAEQEIRDGGWRGPLHGIPVAVKDFYDTAGIRTTAGFEQFQNRVPQDDAAMVTRLRDAGAVLVGKTNMHKLGTGTTSLESAFGAVVNPWNKKHVAGGSSGGSAVAVAAGLCFATIDTDAIGSGRLPAAICGVTCLKPTNGMLSGEGILAGEDADPAILVLSTPCVTARSADDVMRAFVAITGMQPGNGTHAVRKLGVCSNFAGDGDISAAFVAVLGNIEAMGIETLEVEVPFEKASFDVRNAERDRATVNASLFADIDALVLPTLTTTAPTIDAAKRAGPMAVSADNTFFGNYFGLPAVNVSCDPDKNRVPLGVQFVGPVGSDVQLLAFASSYQRSTRWVYHIPTI